MQLSLRDAHRVVTRINNAIKAVDPDVTFDINPWNVTDRSVDNAQRMIDEKIAEFDQQFTTLENLHTARQLLRNLISAANAAHIDETIAEHRYTVDLVSRLKPYASTNVGSNLTTAAAVSARMAAIDASSYAPSISILVLSPERIEQFKTKLRAAERNLEALQDKLTVLNASTKITLPEELVEVLVSSDLIV